MAFASLSNNNVRLFGGTPAQLLQVLRTTSYYNFNATVAGTLTRTITFSVLAAGTSTPMTSNTILTVKPERVLNCTSLATPVDVIFLIDASGSSSSLYLWKVYQSFVSEIIEKLPVSSLQYRCVPLFDQAQTLTANLFPGSLLLRLPRRRS